MSKHPFKPQISKYTRKLLIGTLPPEEVKFYFSNSSNTRLWDILIAIKQDEKNVGKGGNSLNDQSKIEILDSLNVGISDIIYEYERDDYYSTRDTDIDPKKYSDLRQIAFENNIDELLFVYQSAYKWFIHSLEQNVPVKLKRIKSKYTIGPQHDITYKGKVIRCILLPSPLNRGRKNETIQAKLDLYRKHILG